MQVLLKETIYKVGSVGDIVKVKDGYARNFLVPQGKAMKVTAENTNEVARNKKVLAVKKAEELQVKKGIAEKVNGISLELKYKITEEKTLYGSVLDTDIVKALAEKGVVVERRMVRIGEPIRKLGDFVVNVHLAPTIIAELKVSILADEQ
jgi:large subunit ribosomal protein L9